MKANVLKIVVMMLVLAGGVCSCTKWIDKKINEKLEKERTMLPPETQTGENTFGCYVNGELFLWERSFAEFGGSSLSAEYSQATNTLKIRGIRKQGRGIVLEILSPEKDVKKALYKVVYSHNYVSTFGNNLGEITLTRFDMGNNGIVSGTFACEIPYYDEQNGKDSVIQITQGRFDIRGLELEY